MTGQRTTRRRGLDTPEPKTIPAVFRVAFVQALESEQYSDARAARSMKVDASTVERYVSGETPVNASKVAESKRLWRPFWLCVGKLMHKLHGNGAAKKRTAPRVARARKGRY